MLEQLDSKRITQIRFIDLFFGKPRVLKQAIMQELFAGRKKLV
jgi:hypothetical protein